MENKTPIIPAPSEDYPRVRCYRGTGPRLQLRGAIFFKNENIVRLELITDFEGCPGAPIEEVGYTLDVPADLLDNCTRAAFDKWTAEYIFERDSNSRAKDLKIVEKILKKYKLTSIKI